jgi:hypothetical protein
MVRNVVNQAMTEQLSQPLIVVRTLTACVGGRLFLQILADQWDSIRMIDLAYAGAVLLALGQSILGVGVVTQREPQVRNWSAGNEANISKEMEDD